MNPKLYVFEEQLEMFDFEEEDMKAALEGCIEALNDKEFASQLDSMARIAWEA
jgi:hypothetical protein